MVRTYTQQQQQRQSLLEETNTYIRPNKFFSSKKNFSSQMPEKIKTEFAESNFNFSTEKSNNVYSSKILGNLGLCPNCKSIFLVQLNQSHLLSMCQSLKEEKLSESNDESRTFLHQNLEKLIETLTKLANTSSAPLGRKTWSAPIESPSMEVTTNEPIYIPSLLEMENKKRVSEDIGQEFKYEVKNHKDKSSGVNKYSQYNMDWMEKMGHQNGSQDFKRPHPSQTNEQKTDSRLIRRFYQEELKNQIEAKKKLEMIQKNKNEEEEAKLEKRIEAQRQRMKKEYEAEMKKKSERAKNEFKSQDDYLQKINESKRKAVIKRNERAELRFLERKASREVESKVSEEAFRSNSPPIPRLQHQIWNSENKQMLEQIQEMRQDLEFKDREMKSSFKKDRNFHWDGILD